MAPDAHKVELADVAGQALDDKLLAGMGADLAAVHAAYKRRHRERILGDLQSRKPGWLRKASELAERAVRRDFNSLAPLNDRSER